MECQQPYNGAWITDRLPTANDATSFGYVWTTFDKRVILCSYDRIAQGEAWQPIQRPAAYIKPQRYTVGWNATHKVWNLVRDGKYIGCLPVGLPYEAAELAQQIAKFYNEVNQ